MDIDYLDFAPSAEAPGIREIRHDTEIFSELQEDGVVKEYAAVDARYQAEIMPDNQTEGIVYAVLGLPEGAEFDAGSGILQWTPQEGQAGKEFTICFSAEKDGAVSYCSRRVYVYDSVYRLLEECVEGIASGDYEKSSAEQFKRAYREALEEGKRSCASEAFMEKAAALVKAAGELKCLLYEFDFEGDSEQEKLRNKGMGTELLALSGNAAIVHDEQKKSDVLSLDGVYGTYARLPESLLQNEDSFTLFMDVKVSAEGGRLFSLGSSEKSFLGISGGSKRLSAQILSNEVPITAEKEYDAPCTEAWVSIALEVTPSSLRLYQDGRMLAESTGAEIPLRKLGESLTVMLGQSFTIEDANMVGCLDNVKIYRGAYGEESLESAELDREEIVIKAPEQPVKPPAAVKKLVLTPKKATVGVGETLGLTVEKTPAKAKTTYRFRSSAPKVVYVSQKGKIEGKKKGKATITVTSANGKKASCKITVKKAPKKVSFTKKAITLNKGKSVKLKVKLPAGSASRKLIFTSKRKKVASVTSAGKVTAKKAGTAKITVKTFNKKKAYITVRVKKR